jgi:uncharacterized protein (DUF305 family)
MVARIAFRERMHAHQGAHKLGEMPMEHGQENQHASHYRGLLIMAALSFAAMYVLMYAMVDRLANVYASWNQAYMAGVMAAPMVLIELAVMRGMYRNARINSLIAVASVVVFVGCFAAIRGQAGISDRQFLRSMIPHHAGAILMCEEASVHDAEIRKLCETIEAGQQAEIEQMKAKLSALDR